MGKQKTKKGPTRKVPKRRHAEARVLEEPQYQQRVVRLRRVRTFRYERDGLDEEFDSE